MTTYIGNLEVIHCAVCGIPFGVTQDFRDRRLNDKKDFNCPVGHVNVYRGETEADRLRKELERERDAKTHAQRRELEALKRVSVVKCQMTKVKKRIGNGVCPCCNRTFQNLQSHMKTKHKDFL